MVAAAARQQVTAFATSTALFLRTASHESSQLHPRDVCEIIFKPASKRGLQPAKLSAKRPVKVLSRLVKGTTTYSLNLKLTVMKKIYVL